MGTSGRDGIQIKINGFDFIIDLEIGENLMTKAGVWDWFSGDRMIRMIRMIRMSKGDYGGVGREALNWWETLA